MGIVPCLLPVSTSNFLVGFFQRKIKASLICWNKIPLRLTIKWMNTLLNIRLVIPIPPKMPCFVRKWLLSSLTQGEHMVLGSCSCFTAASLMSQVRLCGSFFRSRESAKLRSDSETQRGSLQSFRPYNFQIILKFVHKEAVQRFKPQINKLVNPETEMQHSLLHWKIYKMFMLK